MKLRIFILLIITPIFIMGQSPKVDSLKSIVDSNIKLTEKEEPLWQLLKEVSWTDPTYSMSLLDSLLEMPEIQSDSTKYMEVVRYQGKTQRAVGNYANSLKKYQIHFDYHSRIKDTLGMAVSSSQIGILNLFSGNMNKAQDYLLKSHDYYTAKGSLADIAGANNGLASFYADMNQDDKALERYEMALDAYSEAKDTAGMANIHANMGLVLIDQKKYDEAESHLRTQGKYDSIIGTNWGLGFYFDFMGYLFSEQDRYDEAYKYYMTALEIREGEQSHYNMDESRTSLANVLLKMGKYDEAINHAEKIFENTEKQQSLSHQQSAYEILSDAYQIKGNYKKAFENQKSYKMISDSIYNRDHLGEIAENDAKFNKVEQDTEIALLNSEKITSQRILKQKNRTILIGGISLLLISILSFLLYRVLRKVNDQKSELSHAVRDKDLLIKEIHHRVKNNLQLVSSLLSMQSRTISDPSVSGAIEDGKSRVRSMALIHNDLYQNENLKGVNVKSYLDDLCNELFNTYNINPSRVKLNLNIEDIILDIDTIVPLGLILNELITNSLKYAFPGNREGLLDITLNTEDELLVLEVLDNGIGYELDSIKTTKSFGTKLIKALTKQLKGDILIETKNGTNVKIKFKNFELA